MNEQAQNIAIAEACGWAIDYDASKKLFPITHPSGSLVGHEYKKEGILSYIPSYTTDLNAMHEAEKVLDWDQKYNYGEALARTTIGEEFDDPEGFSPNGLGYYSPITATAAQRSEAFLRTIGKWEESE